MKWPLSRIKTHLLALYKTRFLPLHQPVVRQVFVTHFLRASRPTFQRASRPIPHKSQGPGHKRFGPYLYQAAERKRTEPPLECKCQVSLSPTKLTYPWAFRAPQSFTLIKLPSYGSIDLGFLFISPKSTWARSPFSRKRKNCNLGYINILRN